MLFKYIIITLLVCLSVLIAHAIDLSQIPTCKSPKDIEIWKELKGDAIKKNPMPSLDIPINLRGSFEWRQNWSNCGGQASVVIGKKGFEWVGSELFDVEFEEVATSFSAENREACFLQSKFFFVHGSAIVLHLIWESKNGARIRNDIILPLSKDSNSFESNTSVIAFYKKGGHQMSYLGADCASLTKHTLE